MQTGSEWLSLTRAGESASTANVQSKKTFSPTDPIKIEFDYISWGGREVGADGLAIYLFDASAPYAGTGGYYFSALGYCRIAGGYIGIGLDEYGNFSSSCEGAVHEGPSVPNSATIRGPQNTGYKFVKNFPIEASLDCDASNCQTRAQAVASVDGVKHVLAYLIPKKSGPGYSVNLSINGRTIISGADYPYAAPSLMKVGISASTGTYTNHHEIRNLQINGGRQCAR